ncbi:MAG TPA: hypothetical protein VN616_14510 [Puia sp.]|nr:hypothetical protein [Puia sp.]
MSLTRYYKRTLLIPMLILLCAFIAHSVYEQYTYKSEWLTADAFEPLELLILIIHCAIMACLCLPILTNKRPDIGGNRLRSFLSWFLCPMLYLGGLLYESDLRSEELADLILVLSGTIPFMISLTVTFAQFRRALKRAGTPAKP